MPQKQLHGERPRDGKTVMRPNLLLQARASLEQAERLRQARRLNQAQAACEKILKRFPDYASALHTLGLVLADKQEYGKALNVLVQASTLDPRAWKTLTALSGVYLRVGAADLAARTLERAIELHPGDVNILVTLGEIYRSEREYEAAAETFRRVLVIEPKLAAARMGLGLCATHLGDLTTAASEFEALVDEGQSSVSVLHSLSQLPPALVRSDVLSLLENTTPEEDGAQEKSHAVLEFARASALDRAGRHAEAWHCLKVVNAQLYPEHKDACDRLRSFEDRMLAELRKAKLEVPADTEADTASLFILGPSRAGKTTLERLIAVHDEVKPGYENPILELSVRRALQDADLPARTNILDLPPALDQTFREAYLEEFARRAGDARVFTNTGPGHIVGVARIATSLPGARFLFVKRDPNDIALRIFMKQYRTENHYAYAISTIREHIAWYYQMIDALAELLPERSRVVQYEDVIDDPETALNAATQLCGLPPLADVPLDLGDDRGCADPYLEFMSAEKDA